MELLLRTCGINYCKADSFAAGGHIIPVVNGNVITMGLTNGELTQNGIFHGGETWSVIVSLFEPPVDIAWRVHDDGYTDPPGPIVDAEGVVTISLIGEQRLAKYWNVRDLSGGVVLENQPVVSGVSVFPRRDDLPTGFGTTSAQVADGFEIRLDGSYDAPIVPFDYEITPIDPENPSAIGTGTAASKTTTIFADYTAYGVISSWVYDAFGAGTTNLDTLAAGY
jgi:hypothetical protein